MSAKDEVEHRRRRARFRSWHRGTREMDLILGSFADAEIAHLTLAELEQYEVLLELPDTDFYQWISGERAPPPSVPRDLFLRIRAFLRDRPMSVFP
jgi:antitoxin CptB